MEFSRMKKQKSKIGNNCQCLINCWKFCGSFGKSVLCEYEQTLINRTLNLHKNMYNLSLFYSRALLWYLQK